MKAEIPLVKKDFRADSHKLLQVDVVDNHLISEKIKEKNRKNYF